MEYQDQFVKNCLNMFQLLQIPCSERYLYLIIQLLESSIKMLCFEYSICKDLFNEFGVRMIELDNCF